MANNTIKLFVKFNRYLQSVIFNGYRIGGCKWNDIDNGQYMEVESNKHELLSRLKLLDEEEKCKTI